MAVFSTFILNNIYTQARQFSQKLPQTIAKMGSAVNDMLYARDGIVQEIAGIMRPGTDALDLVPSRPQKSLLSCRADWALLVQLCSQPDAVGKG